MIFLAITAALVVAIFIWMIVVLRLRICEMDERIEDAIFALEELADGQGVFIREDLRGISDGLKGGKRCARKMEGKPLSPKIREDYRDGYRDWITGGDTWK